MFQARSHTNIFHKSIIFVLKVFPLFFFRFVDAFSRFARETLSRASFDINLPSEGSVYDYKIDPYHAVFVPWGDKSQDRAKTLPSGYTIIPEVCSEFLIFTIYYSAFPLV